MGNYIIINYYVIMNYIIIVVHLICKLQVHASVVKYSILYWLAILTHSPALHMRVAIT